MALWTAFVIFCHASHAIDVPETDVFKENGSYDVTYSTVVPKGTLPLNFTVIQKSVNQWLYIKEIDRGSAVNSQMAFWVNGQVIIKATEITDQINKKNN